MNSLYERIKRYDHQIAQESAGKERYFYLSPTRAALTRVLIPIAREYARGRVLDLGAGALAYAHVLKEHAQEYISLDISSERAEPSLLGSVLALPFRDASFDTVFCSQVLEHISDPQAALCEIRRVLAPNGLLILSAPHLAYLHNEPHDYFRFTCHGLSHLCRSAGLQIEQVRPAGGLVCFLAHIPSVVLKALLRPIPFVYDVFLAFNGLVSRATAWLDERIERKKLFAVNYVVVARKAP